MTGLEELLAKSANATLPASRDVGPKRIAGGLLAISVGATVLAALAVFGVVRLLPLPLGEVAARSADGEGGLDRQRAV